MKQLIKQIREFEYPIIDADFHRLSESAASAALKFTATDSPLKQLEYLYLGARSHEMLGYLARHTPWLGDHPKYYWDDASELLENACEVCRQHRSSVPSFLKFFFYGKLAFRKGMTYTFSEGEHGGGRAAEDESDTQIKDAEKYFENASLQDTDSLLSDVLSESIYAASSEATERETRRRLRQMLIGIENIGEDSEEDLPEFLNQTQNYIREFEQCGIDRLTAFKKTCKSKITRAFLDARLSHGLARMLEMQLDSLTKLQRRHLARHEFREKIIDCRNHARRMWLRQQATAARRFRTDGFEVRAAYGRANARKKLAELNFWECIQLSKSGSMQRNSWIRNAEALAHVKSPISKGKQGKLNIEDHIGSFEESTGIPLTEDVRFEQLSSNEYLILDYGRKAAIKKDSDETILAEDRGRKIPFAVQDIELQAEFSNKIFQTTWIYRKAIRDIGVALQQSTRSYKRVRTALEKHIRPVSSKSTNSLHPSVRFLPIKLKSLTRIYAKSQQSYLKRFEDRIVYLWSLLEMFQVGRSLFRSGSLFTGQCALAMRDPHRVDTPIEIGLDPLFRFTIEFILRESTDCLFHSAADLEDMSFRKLVLRTMAITIDNQIRALNDEFDFIDPKGANVIRKVCETRLEFHKSIVYSLDSYIRAVPRIKNRRLLEEEVKRVAGEICESLREAQENFDALESLTAKMPGLRSALFDRSSFVAIREFIEGALAVFSGIYARDRDERRWVEFYQAGEESMRNARSAVLNSKSSYVIPKDRQQEYATYMEARVDTIRGWRSKYSYRYGESGNLEDALEACSCFRRAAKTYVHDLGSLRGAYKARARAAEMRAETRINQDPATNARNKELRYRELRSALLFYSICRDVSGYSRMRKLLLEEFPYKLLKKYEYFDQANPGKFPEHGTMPSPSPKTAPGSYDVFISYNSSDESVARHIADFIQRKSKLSVWFAADTVNSGNNWIDEIESGLSKSKTILVLLGSKDLSNWQKTEIHTGIRLSIENRVLLIPTLLPSVTDPSSELSLLLSNFQHERMTTDKDNTTLTRIVHRIQKWLSDEEGTTAH